MAPEPRRRRPDPARPALRIGRCTFDTEARCLRDPEGGEIALTAMEFDLLDVFARHPRQTLIPLATRRARPRPAARPGDRSIDIRITRLRAKIGEDARNPRTLRTVHGEGYVFDPTLEAPVRRRAAELSKTGAGKRRRDSRRSRLSEDSHRESNAVNFAHARRDAAFTGRPRAARLTARLLAEVKAPSPRSSGRQVECFGAPAASNHELRRSPQVWPPALTASKLGNFQTALLGRVRPALTACSSCTAPPIIEQLHPAKVSLNSFSAKLVDLVPTAPRSCG